MKKSIKWVALVSVVLLAVAVFGGCGKSYSNYEVVNSPAGEEPVLATAPAPVTVPYVAPTWQTVYDVSGTESAKITPAFYLGSGEKRILYNYTEGEYVGIFTAYVMAEGTSLDANGGFPDVSPSASGPGETRLIKDAGMYHLEINAANCSWQVTIQELR